MAQSDFSFSHSLRVRWAEVDMQAVVFNGHYLTYFDVALTEYWQTVGLPSPILQAQLGTELFVKKASLEYHASAKFDDILDIGVRCSKIGHTSITFIIEIYSNEQYLVSGEMIYVFFDRQQQKSTPIPLDWIEMLDLFELSTPIVKKS
jgi:acyl-CoA thioester hydrolase